MPLPVVPPAPWITSPRSVTVAAELLISTPLTLSDRIPPCSVWQSMVIDLVMLTAPKPAESRQLISPLVAVLEIAPAKVLQGAVRLHGLTSSPTPDTQVRVACARAADGSKVIAKKIANRENRMRLYISVPSG